MLTGCVTRAVQVSALVLTFAVAGCSTSAVDAIPHWAGGLPENAPQRLATEMQYPAVNDRPPARDTRVVTVEEQARIEKDLAAARAAQARQAEQLKKERESMLANQPKPNPPAGN